jgi:uncharacterized FlaG/YvyC family protein
MQEAVEWLNKNALYLDEDSKVKMEGLFIYLANTSSKYVDKTERKNIDLEEETRKLLENMRKVVSSIKRGVGVKYLPEREISSVDIEERKSLDDVVREITELMREQMK